MRFLGLAVLIIAGVGWPAAAAGVATSLAPARTDAPGAAPGTAPAAPTAARTAAPAAGAPAVPTAVPAAGPTTAPALTPAPASLERLEALYQAGDLASALDTGEALLQGPLGTGEQVKVLNYLGACCYQLARFSEGVAYLQRALDLLPPGKANLADRASVQNDLGECERAAGRFDAAVRTLEQARATVEQAAPGSELHARILNNIAGLSRDQGDFARTQQLLEEALRITQSAPEASGDRLATAHLNLGELLRYQSRLDESQPHYEAALRVARASYPANHPNLVYFLNQFAVLRSQQGQLAAADSLRQEALRILDAQEGASYPILYAMLLSDAASDLLVAGQPREAARLYERALAMRRGSYGAEHWEVGMNLAQLARAELDARLVPARSVAERASEAIAILDRTPVAPENRADAYAVRALAHLRDGRRDVAAGDLEAAIGIVEDLRARHGGGDESRARLLARHTSYYDEAIDVALREGSVSRAFEYAERFRARALEERLLLDKQRMLAAVDVNDRERLQQEERTAASRLVALQDQQLQLAYDPSVPEAQRVARLARLQSDLEDAVRAYAASQEQIRAHSPAWQALLQRRGAPPLGSLQSRLTAGELMLMYWVGPAHAWLLEIPAASGKVRAHALAVRDADAAVLGIAAGALDAAGLSAVLSPSTRGFGAGPLFEPVRGVAGVADLPAAGESSAAAPSLAAPAQRLHALFNTLVPRAVWNRVRDAREVTIVPAGALHFLPFEALVVHARGSGPARDWLDEGPPLRYAVSATTLLELDRAGRAAHDYPPADVLSVSDPTLTPESGSLDAGQPPPQASETQAPGGRRAGGAGRAVGAGTPVGVAGAGGASGWANLPPLPGTLQESALVQEAFGAGRVEVLSGDRATESAVRARCPDKRYLHFATHAVVDEATSDVLAGLALTREAGQAGADGRLQLYEIDGLRLSAQLAVLSACRTAAGKQIESEGVFALARGFHVAGALRVVASLWSVSDASTAALMGEFFQEIARAERAGERVDYARALRDAKRATKARPGWSQPFYWAPFLLSGAR